MKALLSTISLSLSFVTICGCILLGMRFGPTLFRGFIVFALVYVGGLVAALVVFVTYLSKPRPNKVTSGPMDTMDTGEAVEHQTKNEDEEIFDS